MRRIQEGPSPGGPARTAFMVVRAGSAIVPLQYTCKRSSDPSDASATTASTRTRRTRGCRAILVVTGCSIPGLGLWCAKPPQSAHSTQEPRFSRDSWADLWADSGRRKGMAGGSRVAGREQRQPIALLLGGVGSSTRRTGPEGFPERPTATDQAKMVMGMGAAEPVLRHILQRAAVRYRNGSAEHGSFSWWR
jgi:hypothetical protein